MYIETNNFDKLQLKEFPLKWIQSINFVYNKAKTE